VTGAWAPREDKEKTKPFLFGTEFRLTGGSKNLRTGGVTAQV